jgi:hypothetical protein
MLSFLPKNTTDIMQELQSKFKERRKSIGYTQSELALVQVLVWVLLNDLKEVDRFL